jgi:hypothetical protein
VSSYARSSAIRLFEKILEEARQKLRLHEGMLSLRGFVERVVGLGDVIFPRLVLLSEMAAKALNRLQLAMIESMILASLWSGLILLLIVMIILLLSGW